MKLHILSDLHLGQGALEPPRSDADLVVLAGDIARPAQAVAWARALDKPALYVLGNHEFYGGSIAATVSQLKALCEGTLVQVLDNESVVISGVRFLGSTLWTDFLLLGDGEIRDAATEAALQAMRDYSRIHLDEARQALFTPVDCTLLFRRHEAWLRRQLAQPHPGPTVVITHHAPSVRSIHPRFADSLLNVCFASDAEHLLDGDKVQLWIHGHMHDSFDYRVNGTRVVCNPRGYARNGVNENADFDPGLVVEVG